MGVYRMHTQVYPIRNTIIARPKDLPHAAGNVPIVALIRKTGTAAHHRANISNRLSVNYMYVKHAYSMLCAPSLNYYLR